MLSSGVETQPVPLDPPMSSGAQELYMELPGSVSPELSAEFEPSIIPDAKPEPSSSLLWTLPLEPRRTHGEDCPQDAEPLDDEEEPWVCGLAVDSAARDPVASGVLEKESAIERGKQKTSRGQGKQEKAGAVRILQEGSAQGQKQPAPVAAEEAQGSHQVVLGKQLEQEQSPSEDRLYHHTEENQGNVQVTTETLPKPTEEGQGMKVNGTKMISNAEHRNYKVSKSLPPGCIGCPNVDKTMASGEVSEISTLVSLEPRTSVEPGLTKAPSTEKECETSSACPLRPPSLEDNASLPLGSGEVLSRLSLNCEAVDNHQHTCGCGNIENPSNTRVPQVKNKESGVLSPEADPQGSCFPLSLPTVWSGSNSLEKCGPEDDLQKMEKAFWTGEVLREEGSASRLEEKEQVQSSRSQGREVRPVDTKPGREEIHTPPLNHACDQGARVLGNGHIHSPGQRTSGSLQPENSVLPSEGDPTKVPSEIQENFKKHDIRGLTCPFNVHQDEDSLEESYSSVKQTEESEKTLPGHTSVVLGKDIDSWSPGSLISSQKGLGSSNEKRDTTACAVPEEPPTSVSQVSEVSRVLSQLQMDKKGDLAHQSEAKETLGISSRGVVPFVDGQGNASHGQNEFASFPAESTEDRGKLLGALSGKVSFDVCDRKEATLPQELCLGDKAEDLCKGTSEVSQQQASSLLEDGDKVIANQRSHDQDAFHPGATSRHASFQDHDVNAKVASFQRVPDNTVKGKLVTMSGLEKGVAELSEEAPDLGHETAPSQGCHSCHHRAENAPEADMHSKGVIYKSIAISPEAENQSVLTYENILMTSEPHYPGTESSLVESTLSLRHPSRENELSREEIEDSVQEGKIRNEVASCSLLSRALNKRTPALSRVKPGSFKARSSRKVGLEENKLETQSKETAIPYKSHPSEHTILESKQSSNIPSPEETKDPYLNTECSGVRILNQVDGANQGLNCQSDLNSPVEHWNESKSSMSKYHSMGVFEAQHTDSPKSQDVKKHNKSLSSRHKELLGKDSNNIQPSCSLPKKKNCKSTYGNEESTVCRADLAHVSNKPGEEVLEMEECDSEAPSWLQSNGPLRSDQPQEGKVHAPLEELINQDSLLPCASNSFNMGSLKTTLSCKGTASGEQRDEDLGNAVSWESKKLCQVLRDREPHVSLGSLSRGMRSVTNHESNTKLSESLRCGRIDEGMLPGETEGTTGGLKPQKHSAVDDEDSLEGYSKEPVLGSVEIVPLQISSQENSATGSDAFLGEKAETNHLPELVSVQVLPERSILKTKVKKRQPGETPHIDTGTPGAFQPKPFPRMTPSSFELNLKDKINRRETGEHQETLNEGKTLRQDGGDKNSDAFKRKRICGETEAEKAQIVQGCRYLKGGREGTQPKKRGTFCQREASLNAKPSIWPRVGPSSQYLTSQSHLKGYAHNQSTLKDVTGAEMIKGGPFPQSLEMNDSEAVRRAPCLSSKAGSSLGPTMITPDSNGMGWEKIHDTFVITPHGGKSLLNITWREPIKTGRKTNDVQKGIPLKNTSETISAAPPTSASAASHTSKPKVMRRLLLNSLRLQKSTKESALLNKLSVLAGKLLPPPTATQELGSQPRSTELLPVAETYKWLRCKKLQDESPCDMMQLNLHVGDQGCKKTHDSQTLALCPLEALRAGFLDLNKMPSLQFSAQLFPISFHINLDSELTNDSMRIFSEHCSPPENALRGHPTPPSQPPKWTFSFLMSQGSSGTVTFREDAMLSCELLSPAALQTLSPGRAPENNAIVKARASCSVLGLPTVLALSSPGCYRIWTRRRSLSGHWPTLQRFFMTQFTQGIKGLRLPASLSNSLFPSLPYSVGRGLSMGSQHGPPACPFEITPLHSKHSKWPPTLGISNSHATLPHVPLLGMEATTARSRDSPVRPGPTLSALVPKSCFAFEPVVSVFRLSASDFQIPALKELRRVPPVGSSEHGSATQKEIESEKRPKKVSQIRIRKTIPRPDPNLTPMGLPRPKRLKKKEFSLEEIYTNKNYKSPPASRCLETIFEEPKERNGALISISQQKRKRVLEFQDFTVPRKRRSRGKIKVMGSFTRAKKAALQNQELDALLVQKLMDLEAFLAKEGEDELASGC